jgi:putative lipase involved disintegration of autophagic bodies
MSLLHSNSNCVISTLFLHHPQLSYSPTYHRQNCYDLIRYLSDHSGSTKATYSIHTSSIKTHRPSSFASFSNAQLRSLQFGKNEWVDWEEGGILGPNVESRETLLELAKMTNNAYLEPDETGWCSLNGTWNVVRLFHPSPFT